MLIKSKSQQSRSKSIGTIRRHLEGVHKKVLLNEYEFASKNRLKINFTGNWDIWKMPVFIVMNIRVFESDLTLNIDDSLKWEPIQSSRTGRRNGTIWYIMRSSSTGTYCCSCPLWCSWCNREALYVPRSLAWPKSNPRQGVHTSRRKSFREPLLSPFMRRPVYSHRAQLSQIALQDIKQIFNEKNAKPQLSIKARKLDNQGKRP